MRRLALISALVAGLLSLPASPASAAVTCTFSAGIVTIDMSASGDGVFIRREPAGDDLEFVASGSGVTCSGGTPTVNTADTVKVNDTAAGGNTFVIISLGSGPFAPGATDEPGTSDEIEFDISLGDGLSDQLQFLGTENTADRWTFGADGINLNAGETTGIDVDITIEGVDSTDQLTASGNDVVDGGGGEGTGGPFEIRMSVQGGDGRDRITGSTADDFIEADGVLPYADNVNGGAGWDTFSLRFAGSGVLVDLRRGIGGRGAGADVISNIEEVVGSEFADVLIGNARANILSGDDGNDRLRPVGAGSGAATDAVIGGDDLDTVDYSNEGRRVTVDLTSSESGCDQTAKGPSIAVDCLFEIERAIGTPRGDQLLGDGTANILTGGRGDDELRGRDGPDVLRGKAGDDRLFGEAGEDRLDGGKHRDRCVGGPDPDTFRLCERRVQ